MPNLFERAASLLLGDSREDVSDPDARLLLELLGYAQFPAVFGKSSAEAHHRARLLMLASRFLRVFELAAPEAPGPVCFGAEIDPAMADPLHAGNSIVSVSGVGPSPQEAFQGCIGEGIEEGIEYLFHILAFRRHASLRLASSLSLPRSSCRSLPT
jgi:ribosomal protein S12 methylthiotransferase accessory factor